MVVAYSAISRPAKTILDKVTNGVPALTLTANASYVDLIGTLDHDLRAGKVIPRSDPGGEANVEGLLPADHACSERKLSCSSEPNKKH